MPAHGTRLTLSFLDVPSKWHDEQCTLAEFCAHVVRDVIAHVDLAAEARVKNPTRPREGVTAECEDSESDDAELRVQTSMEFVDMGGGDGDTHDDYDQDVSPTEQSNFPLRDVDRTIPMRSQQDDIAALKTNIRWSKAEFDLRDIADTYAALLEQSFAMDHDPTTLEVRRYSKQHHDMIAPQ